jgi:hypothetical protein
MNHEPPYLHVYGQKYPHAVAGIVGNREALERLSDALERALSLDYANGKPSRIEAFTNDGEGYSVSVRCIESKFQELELPYTEKW